MRTSFQNALRIISSTVFCKLDDEPSARPLGVCGLNNADMSDLPGGSTCAGSVAKICRK